MRRTARRCVALFMAVLMLLTSMPMTALADTVSSGGFQVPGVKSGDGGNNETLEAAMQAVENAVIANQSNGTINIYSASAKYNNATVTENNRVPTGDSFTYQMGVQFNPPIQYEDKSSGSGKLIQAYNEYKNIRLVLEIPDAEDDLVFMGEDNKATKTSTVTISNVSVSAGGNNIDIGPVSAYMTNNGELNEDTYSKIKATLYADVVLLDPAGKPFTDENGNEITYTFQYELNTDNPNNRTDTYSRGSVEWTVEKGAPSFVNNDNGEVVVTWKIKAGLKGDNNQVLSNRDNYDVVGMLNFNGYAMTDTLPTISGYAPKSWTLSVGGKSIDLGSDANVSTSYLNSIDLTKGRYNVDDGSANPTDKYSIPYYTEYTLTAVYDRAAFVLDYNVTDNIKVDNTAAIEYTPVGGDKQSASANATGEHGIETKSGSITITESLILHNDQTKVPYNKYYSDLFPAAGVNGVQFDIYKWDEATGAYGTEPVNTVSITGANGNSTTIDNLAPGKYKVVQVDATKPKGSESANPQEIEVTVTSEGKVNADFTNRVPGTAIISIRKIVAGSAADGGNGKGIRDVEFEITGDNGYSTKITTNTDGGYILAVPAKDAKDGGTTYTITETYTPDEYYKSEYKTTITVYPGSLAEANTLTVENTPKGTGSLTINKKLNNENTDFTDTGASFTFYIYQGQKDKDGNIVYNDYGTVTLPKNGSFSTTVDGIPAADDNGVPYYYKVVEADLGTTVGANKYYTKDNTEHEFDFWDETNNRPASGTALRVSTNFVNKLEYGDLKIKKELESLTDGNKPMSGVVFGVYTEPNATTSVATITTDEDGTGTTDSMLPIYGSDGTPKKYYIKEISTGSYTVKYPGDNESYWGPITLSETNRVTDLTSTPVVNKKNEAKLTIRKQSTGNAAIKDATFTVQNDKGQYAALVDGGIILQNDYATFDTSASGLIELSGLPTGTYTVTEVSVPSPYVASGSVTVSVDNNATTSGGDGTTSLSATVTLTTLGSETVTFSNKRQPRLRIIKQIDNTNQPVNTYTFGLYEKNDAGEYVQVRDANNNPVVIANSMAFTDIDVEPGTYYIKELTWPAGVVAPADDEYTEVTLGADQTETSYVSNESSITTLTLKKQDGKTQKFIAGAKVQIAVTNDTLTDADKALLAQYGFTSEGSFASTQTVTINNASGLAVQLPAYLADGKTQASYTVLETEAPNGYILDATIPAESVSLVDADGKPASAEHTFVNNPKATLTVTKNYYKQWEDETDNKREYPLQGVTLAVFEEENDELKLVGTTAVTDANGQATFTDLDATKTYYVFEINTPDNNLYKPESGTIAGSTDAVAGKTLKDVSGLYYVTVDLSKSTNNQGVAKMTNVEGYVQVKLYKWYHPERIAGTEAEPVWEDDQAASRQPLNRAKFYLYSCNEDVIGTVRSTLSGIAADTTAKSVMTTLRTIGGVTKHDYVYESGIGAKDGWVVTEGLPATDSNGKKMYYWLVEFEAPSGFKSPVARCWSNIVSIDNNDGDNGGALENHPDHGDGDGVIHYVQIALDKVARWKEDGEYKYLDLADTTFTLYLVNGNEREYITHFTTGVDETEDGAGNNENYQPGHGVSESFEMRALKDKYSDAVRYDEKTGEYTATFVLVETSWPGNTTPVQLSYTFTLTTNGDHDIDESTGSTLWAQYVKAQDGSVGNAIVNELTQQVTVKFDKRGYKVSNSDVSDSDVSDSDVSDSDASDSDASDSDASDSDATWPLAGAGFTIYRDSKMENPVGAEKRTDQYGEVFFNLEPNTTYYWKETTVPDGYEATGTISGSFTTQPYESQTASEMKAQHIATVKNVQYRELTLTKVDASGNKVNATFQLTNTATNETYTLTLGADGEGTIALPNGTYTIEETHLNGTALTDAEKQNFKLLNDDKDGQVDGNVTVTFGDNATKTVALQNPGTGSITANKVNDKNEAMGGVRFRLYYRTFNNASELAQTTIDANAITWDPYKADSITVVKGSKVGDVSGFIVATDANGELELSGLIPGWYKLVELACDANAKHVLAADTVFKVTDDSFGGTSTAPATITNQRYGKLTISKAFEAGATADAITFTISEVNGDFTKTVTLNATNGWKDTIDLKPGASYTIKEDTTGDWYVRYTVTGSTVEGENKTAWLNADQSDSVTVTIGNGNADTAVKVDFTNVGNTSALEIDKVDGEGNGIAGVTFNLYYLVGENNKVYYKQDNTWGGAADNMQITTGADGKATREGIKLPYSVTSDNSDGALTLDCCLEEVSAPAQYAPIDDVEITLTSGRTTSLTDDKAIVNTTGLQIELTKYGKPHGDATSTDILGGAQFKLYTLEDGQYKEVQTQTTSDSNGQLTFTNLSGGVDYYIRETVTPSGYVEGSLEVYIGETQVQPNEAGYYRVTDTDDVSGTVAVSAYNTKLAQIYLLKYDLVNKTALPVGALFTMESAKDGNNYLTADGEKHTYTIGASREANGDDPDLDDEGYNKVGNHYEKGGQYYTIATTQEKYVVPGTYIITEPTLPDGYLSTPNADANDEWSHTKTVLVEPGSVTIVTFANVPDPKEFDVTITKTANSGTFGSLQVENGQTVEYTIGGFSEMLMPTNSVVITDEDVRFYVNDGTADSNGGTVNGGTADSNLTSDVTWSMTALTIGKVSYNTSNPLYEDKDAITYADVSFKVGGAWSAAASYDVSSNAANVTVPVGAQGIKISYREGNGGLRAGFMPGDISLSITASQPNDKDTVPVTGIYNKAHIEAKYNSSIVGSTQEVITKNDDDDETVAVEAVPTLPRASIAKTVTTTSTPGSGLTNGVVAVGDTVEWTVTLTGEANGFNNGTPWGVQNPVLSDVVPNGLEIISATAEAKAANLNIRNSSASVVGQVVKVETDGELCAGETITLKIQCRVLAVALVDNVNGLIENTAYVHSPYKLPQNFDNPNGVSFAEVGGDLVNTKVPDEVASNELGIADSESIQIVGSGSASISKFVTVGNQTAGAERVLSAEVGKGENAGQTITYSIIVSNNGETDLTNVWVSDTLPYKGDSNNSGWAPKLSSAVSSTDAATTVYYTTDQPNETKELVAKYKDEGAPEGYSASWQSAKSFIAVIPKVPAKSTVTLTYNCTAPSTSEADNSDTTYYYLAVNDAHMKYANGPAYTSSADTYVTVIPEPVGLGDEVWVDKNANGKFDRDKESLYTLGGIGITLTTYREGEAVGSSSNVFENGKYFFDNLTPAAPGASGTSYDGNGVLYGSLRGEVRHTYQLEVSNIPTGYRITKQYAGGTRPTVESSGGANDSNFDPVTRKSEIFYLRSGSDDLRYDIGLVRERNLTITKKGTNDATISGAEFSIYGPYDAQPTKISADDKVATYTTGTNGGLSFVAGKDDYLNAYAYYVVVETTTPVNYDAANLTVSGGNAYKPDGITGEGAGISNGNYFVLRPDKGENMSGAVQENLTVTNTYKAEGKLLISGTKQLEGTTLAAEAFSFKLTSENDTRYDTRYAGNNALTVKNDASGNFVFGGNNAITYDYSHVKNQPEGGYVYTLTEVVPENTDGIAYDATVYTITVTLSDTDADGKITVKATVTSSADDTWSRQYTSTSTTETGICTVSASDVKFTNRKLGGLTITKQVDSNDGDKTKDFNFTLTLKKGNDDPLVPDADGNLPFTYNGSTVTAGRGEDSNYNGTYTFTLEDSQTLTISGLLADTKYTIEEDDYKSEGYITETTGDSVSGDIETGKSVTFTNTRDVGGLTISKTVSGNAKDADKTFEFTVTLKHDSLPLDNTYGDAKFSTATLEQGETGYKATATFTLKDGESKKLTGIPAGTTYTVTEDDYKAEGYVTTHTVTGDTSNSGVIDKGENITVAYTNTRDVGNLTVKKTVSIASTEDSQQAVTDKFNITVALKAPDGMNLSFRYYVFAGDEANGVPTDNTAYTDVDVSVDAETGCAEWSNTFELANGERVFLGGMPKGTEYTVTEADYSKSGYTTSYGIVTENGEPLSTGKGAIGENTTYEAGTVVNVTNSKSLGGLTITKASGGNAFEQNRTFSFTVTLENANVEVAGTYSNVAFTPVTENGTKNPHKATATVTITGSGSVTLTGIPVGTTYTVTEADYKAEGYVTTVGGTDTNTATGTIANGADGKPATATVTFTNTRNTGNLTVTKVVAGNGAGTPNALTEFDFTVTLTPPTGVALTGTVNDNDVEPSQTVTLKAGESVKFTGLPTGTTYTVAEANYAKDGYTTEYAVNGVETLLTNGVITGTIGENLSSDPGVTVTATNTLNVGNLTITKVLDGNTAEGDTTEFKFTVTLENDDVEVNKTYGNVPFTAVTEGEGEASKQNPHKATATVTITGSGSVTLTGIPADTKYTVEESSEYFAQGYKTKVNGTEGYKAEGYISSTDAVTVTFTNTRNVGDLTVTKVVTGAGATAPGVQTEFEILVTLTAPAGVNLTGSYTSGDDSKASGSLNVAAPENGSATWSETFTLAADETVVFEDLPEGTTYKVSETDYTKEGFITTFSLSDEGTIDAAKAEAASVTVNNYRPAAGLTITKKVTGTGESEDDIFTFKLTLTNATKTVAGTYEVEYNTVTVLDAEGEGDNTNTTTPTITVATDGTATFTLKGKQSMTINGIPTGTDYKIEEIVENGATTAPAVKGTVNENGYALITDNNVNGTIASEDGTYKASFTNERKVGNLTVTKVVAGNGAGSPNALDEFEITVRLTAPKGVNLTGSYKSTDNSKPEVMLNEQITSADDQIEKEYILHLAANETVKFTGLPADTQYTVTEKTYVANGYDSQISGASGKIAENTTAEEGALATVTNTLNVGNLTVKKALAGNAPATDKDFTFTVTLSNATVEVNKDYGGDACDTFEPATAGYNHVTRATFTLKGGESLTLTGIPVGTTYTVTEESYLAEGYVTTQPTNYIGTISMDAEGNPITAEVTYTNTRNVGDLTVTKQVTGSGAASPNAQIEFSITVKLTAPTGMNLTGSYTSGDADKASGTLDVQRQPNTEAGSATWSETFTLAAGETVVFEDLPAGTSYEVTEGAIDGKYGFEAPSYTNASGSITASDSVEKGTFATVTNTIYAGDITVSKMVGGSGGDTNRPFNFNLQLSNPGGKNVDATYAVTGTASMTSLTVTGGSASFSLKHGETITIHGIPTGTDYIITEKKPRSDMAGYLADGYVTRVNGQSGTVFSGTNLTQSGASASFTNTRDVGELSISKQVSGGLGETDRAFEFTLRLEASGNGVPVSGTYGATLYTGAATTATAIMVGADGVATFTLMHDQTLVIHGLPANAEWGVSEASYSGEGYETSITGATGGRIPASGQMPHVTFTNTRNAGNLAIQKTLAGNAPIADDTFEFTVTLSRTDGRNVDGAYAALLNGEPTDDVVFADGVATVTLVGAATLEIANIPYGTDYTVVENLAQSPEYELTASSGTTGTIPVGATQTAAFTNARNIGALTIGKLVEGNVGELERDFNFTVFMRDRNGNDVNGTFAMSGIAETSVTFVDGYATIQLASGEQATIEGILAGTYYSVTEVEANTEGYVTTYTGDYGIIAAGVTAQASFTNTRQLTYTSLTVRKSWNDQNDADGLRPDELIVYLMADGSSIAQATLNAANGWSAVFENIPTTQPDGTPIAYRVVESVTAGYYAYYQYLDSAVNITNTHTPDPFTPTTPETPTTITLIDDGLVPLGGNINMNEGDCFN